MKTILIRLVACVCLSHVLQAQAASTVELNVSGRITPSACAPSLSDGGVYDLGKIAAKDLNSDRPTLLPATSLQLAITCEAMTLLALEPRDNRLGSSYNDSPNSFGLGLTGNNAKLGFLLLTLDTVLADGVEMIPIGSTASSSWSPTSILSHHFLTAFAPKDVFAPAPVQQLTAQLHVAPALAPANTLPLSEEVPFEGSVTLTIKYL
ncbi:MULTISPECIES: DUF1120 domain-containing protein [Pseudomonas]|jgi:type 1 fimbria pilin|uniref:Protein GltF n=1 Tax=Pseudomonas extremorientalis TaxID=169669 RepID=A0A1H0V491_9PSED|nr:MULTISPECIES: DUF1120 domain-containing protein [Pseudomonas]KAB0521353.1 DUF1120 domain-containing protein [Pseudomonas extremorientalis]OIN11288.1 hypothetical protein BFN10_04150 [Pseudomonas extremorientalis]QZP22291.1 DUF1120 domain-containing protein [Pseudomonas sp. DR208]UUN89812.1 DUF1120 domain-containing protein [Pseudomonas extremorientalis]WLG58007.1 DUF1120 domain-containing protein [Pseudomonas extremorientalis]